MSTDNKDTWKPATKLVHGGTTRSSFGETSEAMYLTQGFVYGSAEAAEARFLGEEPGYIYSRYANPTVSMFEKRMCEIEGAEAARATASGMAAVHSALMASVRAGDHVIAPKALFGSCRYIIEQLLPRFGVESTLIDGTDFEQWKAALRPNTKVAFMESPTNPTLDVIDIQAVADLMHNAGARLIVDNVFATAIWQSPLALGADVVIYSATKHIDGQGRCLGGVVLSDEKWITEEFHDPYKHTGPAMSPFNAWVLLKGLETLPLRVERQTYTAGKVANLLAEHDAVSRLVYPGRDDHPQAEIAKKQMRGGSTMLAFDLAGGKEAAFKFSNALNIVQLSNNLGDAKSLITHPATTTHQSVAEEARLELGISDKTLRLSIGIEDTDDLLADVEQALAQV
ncbi:MULTISPECIES: O-succinylhomoserine sulfhydrylase [Pseudovibrio]|uniref:O-succinylhomoserine sulfhydrylase n=1 Tax=Stappiaceae TaxID=2821832 RepID=UPI0023665592|nr:MULTISPECIES: O-succinylhomoserine sulfhydrylase [Pseudovibrio]MDD7909416.1 O-succinylhomoserine sulfhydrylase [Pseudovibrio exalbescens]MDX5594975.1 O-succinylhomoserine sulfhydrylase [Pseudovibrio sp. SPO723]